MQMNTDDVLKVFAAFFGAGGGFAFFRPFAGRLFTLWLDRIAARQKAEADRAAFELERERAFVRVAEASEESTSVLREMLDWLKRLDARQDRVEAHLGIPLTASTVPAAPDMPTVARRQPTDPGIQAAPRAALPSVPGAAHG
jgi:hypothetical protein